jgi:hypothetical protein
VKQTSAVRTCPGFGWLLCRKNRRPPASRLQDCGLLLLLICLHPFLSGCRKAGESVPDITIVHEIAPQPPKIGPATITLKLSDPSGAPKNGAQVSLEGNMSHPGMSPVFGKATETGPGRYEAPIEFTMAGDWMLIIHITLPDGRKFERQLEVKAVQSG